MKTVKNLECFSLSEKNYVTSFFFCLPGNQEPPPAQVLFVATTALYTHESSALFPYLDLLILFNQLNCMTLV